ncbi:hypothetical protein BGW80DRAFT_1260080 [Lactifluus volemus]|nr:hypothetical protein BGW80DRAFT_1260080 [Lactifluus volemus]
MTKATTRRGIRLDTSILSAGKKPSIMKVLSDPKTKSKRTGNGVVGDYKKLAQWIGRSEDTFIDFDLVFHIGMECEGSDDDIGDDDASTRTETEREDDDHVFTIISENIPTFESDLKKFKKNPRALEKLCGQMTTSLGFARSDDIRILREDGLDYVATTQPNNDLMPDIPPHSSKPTYRGWNHPVLAELLCPVEHLDKFRAHPTRTIHDFMNGSLRVTADQLCLFMYRNYSVDYENLMDGLLCSDLIKMTWRRLFQNAKPGKAGRRIKRKRQKPDTYFLSSVTPRSIAYATLHTRWFLSGVEDWRKDDGKVDKATFYYTIINLFKRKDMKCWSEAVLHEWNNITPLLTICGRHVYTPFACVNQSPTSVNQSITFFLETCIGQAITPIRPNVVPTCRSQCLTPIRPSVVPTCRSQCLTSISAVCVGPIIASITTHSTAHLSICESTPSNTVFQHRVAFNHTYRDHQ